MKWKRCSKKGDFQSYFQCLVLPFKYHKIIFFIFGFIRCYLVSIINEGKKLIFEQEKKETVKQVCEAKHIIFMACNYEQK